MGNKTGSVRKLDSSTDSDDEPISTKPNRKNTQHQPPPSTNKGCETEPPNRRRSSGGQNNGNDSSSSSTATSSKKKSHSLLSEHQKQLISRSWKQHVNRHSTENVGVRIFYHIFETSSEIKHMFGFDDTLTRDTLLFDKRFQKQAKLFVRVIDECVRDIENLEEDVQKRLHALGARHVRFRSSNTGGAIKMQHWDIFAESMLESIIDSQRGVHKYRDTTATWRIFITWIIGIMKQGYYETLRIERRATTAGLPHQQSIDQPSPTIRSKQQLLSTGPLPLASGGSGPAYTRNHSVSYGHGESELLRQLHPPPSSNVHQHHHQNFLEPSTITCRSAPHSPYVVKNPPRHYPSQQSSSSGGPNLQLQYDIYPKRSLALEDAPNPPVLIPGRNRSDTLSGHHYQNYEYPENDYDYENEEQSKHDENYSSRHYYSDYY